MKARLIVTAAFAFLAVFGFYGHTRANVSLAGPTITALRAVTAPAQGGSLPAQWDAGNDCANEGDFQVWEYNEDLYIIRQSKCVHFEAPFMYLIFGDGVALLMDTGSSPNVDLYGTVMRVMWNWSRDKGVPMPDLIVGHSHSHGDHFAGDSQFVGQPHVLTVVGTNIAQVRNFWGFQNWPFDVPTFDLGGRIIDVLATPGHQAAGITLYDRRTQLLLTGDIVYPGHLFVFSPNHWGAFGASLRRMIRFARTNPVRWVLGCHIEMSNTPFGSYAWGTPVHPDERKLEFHPSKLTEIYDAFRSFNGSPVCTKFEDFVIHPVYQCSISWN